MAASFGDLIQVTDEQTFLSQQVLNVYYYRVTALTGFAFPLYQSLCEQFVTTVIVPLKAIQNNQLSHQFVRLRNLSNGVDLFDYQIPLGTQIGAQAGDALPSFVTFTFRLNRTSLVTRNGYKRFAGVSEGFGAGNSYNPTAPQAAAINAGLSADIVVGLVTLVEPIIVKRPLPIVGGVYEYSSIDTANYQRNGTQNTRKSRVAG